MKDSYKCYEKVLIVIVTAIVLCFSVHVRASGVGNKESAQEIVNEYFSLIGNDWDKFAELYTNEQINSFKNFLENEKNIMNDSCQVITDLQNSLISDIENLEPSSVCIQEIRSTSTVSSEINSKCASALKTAEIVVLKIDMQIKNAKKEYDEWSDLSSKCQQQKSNCESKLTTLNTEFTQAQEEEALAAVGGV